MRNKKKFIALFLLVGLAVVFAAMAWFRSSRKDADIIRVSGNIEVTDAEVSFKIAGRVIERVVDEGETIGASQLVARLDDRDLVQEMALRRAEVEVAAAALAELEAGSRPEEIAQAAAVMQRAQAQLDELLVGSRVQEIRAAAAAVEQARADVERLRADYERQDRLYRREVISTREFEASRTAYDASRARLNEATERFRLVQEGPRKEDIEQARAALKETQERYALVKKGPREETIDQARARLRQAKEALALAETRLSYATLVSPLTGMVLAKNIEPGEYVAPGTPIVTVGDLYNVYLRAYVNETDLGRVKLGQHVRVTTDTYPGKGYDGIISFIASQAEFTPKHVQTDQERVKLVYRVKVTIPNPAMELKPGMPADAVIVLGE